MKRLATAAFVVALVGLAGVTRAEDKGGSATGTWKWEFKRGDQAVELTLKLKQDGDKLTGTFIGPDGKETAIEDGKVKDGELSFKVTRERDGNKFIIKYTGKVSGDAIKGKTERERDGETQSRDWEAKRAKD
jgi:hypothetical protein